MIIYKIDLNTGYYAGTMEVPDDPDDIYGIPYGTTKKAPPNTANYAVWNGSGWDAIAYPPPKPAPIIAFIKVDAFYERFGQTKYNIIFSEDPEVKAYVQRTRSVSYIDLNDPEVSAGVDRLLELGFVFDKETVLNLILSPEEQFNP